MDHRLLGVVLGLLLGVSGWVSGWVGAQSLEDVDRMHPLLRGLVAWYPVLPHLSGGSRWYDLSGKHHHGTLTNSPTWGADPSGRFAGGVRFASTAHVSLPDAAHLDFGTGPFTACLQFQVTGALTVDQEYQLLTKSANFENSPGWFLGIHTYNGGSSTVFSVQMGITTSVSYLSGLFSSPPAYTLHQPYRLCGRRASSTSTLWMNGQPAATFTDVEQGLNVDNSLALVVGYASGYAGGVNPGAPLVISNVMLWPRALSAADLGAYTTLQAPDYGGLFQAPALLALTMPPLRRTIRTP